MKKIIVLICSYLILLTGCSSLISNEKGNKEEAVIEEITNKFVYQTAQCRIDNAKVVFSELNRNDEITIIDEDDDFYYFDNNGLVLAIEKTYVRTDNEEAFEEYTGYAYSGAEVFSDYELNDKIADLYKNDEVTVIDKIGKVLLVDYEGEERYMYQSDVSDSYIVTYYYVAPVVEEPVSTPSYSGGGGGGGSYTPPAPVNPDPPAPSTPADNFFDIANYSNNFVTVNLGFVVSDNKTEFEPNDSYTEVNGKVLLDGAITYITLCNRDEDIKVLEYDDENVHVLINGFVGLMKRDHVRLEEDETYDTWSGYAYGGSVVYYDYDLENKKESLYKNDEITVIDEINGIYYVMLEDGTYGYMDESDVSETKLATYYYVAPVVEEPVSTPSYSGGGGGGGSYTPPAPVNPDPPANPVETGSYM